MCEDTHTHTHTHRSRKDHVHAHSVSKLGRDACTRRQLHYLRNKSFNERKSLLNMKLLTPELMWAFIVKRLCFFFVCFSSLSEFLPFMFLIMFLNISDLIWRDMCDIRSRIACRNEEEEEEEEEEETEPVLRAEGGQLVKGAERVGTSVPVGSGDMHVLQPVIVSLSPRCRCSGSGRSGRIGSTTLHFVSTNFTQQSFTNQTAKNKERRRIHPTSVRWNLHVISASGSRRTEKSRTQEENFHTGFWESSSRWERTRSGGLEMSSERQRGSDPSAAEEEGGEREEEAGGRGRGGGGGGGGGGRGRSKALQRENQPSNCLQRTNTFSESVWMFPVTLQSAERGLTCLQEEHRWDLTDLRLS